MNNYIVILVASLLTSCSSSAKAKWKIDDVSDAEKKWRNCHERLDGAAKHRKGFCYISRECRKRIFRKRECRPLPLFCKYGDGKCFEKYGLFNKTLQ